MYVYRSVAGYMGCVIMIKSLGRLIESLLPAYRQVYLPTARTLVSVDFGGRGVAWFGRI